MSFQNKNYVIFGGSSTIAKQLTQSLTTQGASVHSIVRKQEQGLDLEKEYGVTYSVCETTNFEALDSCLSTLALPIAGFVNCCGSIWLKSIDATSTDNFLNVLEANLLTSFHVVKAASKYLQDASVVLFSSTAASIGLSNHEAIAAAKAGVEGLVLSSAASFVGKKIRINAIAPGLVDTKMSEFLTKNPTMLKYSEAMHPLQRIGRPEDIVNATLYFLNPDNSWITGQILKVDGGISTIVPKVKV